MGRLESFIKENRAFCNKYNKKLEAYYKGCEYLEDKNRTEMQIDKWTPRLMQYTYDLSIMMMAYKELTGEAMPSNIVQNGFLLYDLK